METGKNQSIAKVDSTRDLQKADLQTVNKQKG
jgi:molybdate-binding protein